MILAVVPAYNEEANIHQVVKNLRQFVDKVVVVDDASTDKTFSEAQKAGATVIRHKLNRGQGAALETGHTYARSVSADTVVHFDGDGQFDPAEIPQALAFLKKHKANVLLGSRFLEKKSNIPAFKKIVLLPLARLFDRVFTGLSLSDAHNGFRILDKKALHTMHLVQNRMAHASEIPQQIKQHSLKFVEFPVTVQYTRYGQSAHGAIAIIKDTLTGLFIR